MNDGGRGSQPFTVLIVKLGALGDVLRTTPLLTAYKREHPGCRITWVVDARHRDVLEANPLIDELLDHSAATVGALRARRFDLAINLDKEEEALDAIAAAGAVRKAGFGRGARGEIIALDGRSDYAVRLGLDDELKFRTNRKSYQEISFEQAGLAFGGEEYLFEVDAASGSFAAAHLAASGAAEPPVREGGPRPVIGLNTGSGTRFAGKRLPETTFAELAGLFVRNLGATVLLLGGRDEIERNERIRRLCPEPVVHTGSHPIRRFAAIVGRSDLVVSGDTTAMHIAIALKVPVVAYFASTSAPEIELYGRGRKVVSDLACAPCYKKVCPIGERCMTDLRASELYTAALETLPLGVRRGAA